MLDGNGLKVVSLSWEEGRLFDLWMIVHLLSGFVIGFSAYLIGIEVLVAYFGTLAGLSLYEVVEEIFRIDETLENRISDIIFGTAGFAVSYSLIAPYVESDTNTLFLVVVSVLCVLMSFLGWRSYKKRGLQKEQR